MNDKAHWDAVYGAKRPLEASWFQAVPARSLALLRETGAGPDTRIIDVGGGSSNLVDAVVAGALGRMTVLDVSPAGLELSRERLGARADEVTWIAGDVTRLHLPASAFDVWHDRAVFHFLTDAVDRAAYVTLAASAVRPGGVLMIATFAPDGPSRCSGLPVHRYSAAEIARELGDAFVLVREERELHITPSGSEQAFTVALFRRRATT